jgi:hypothetical protein
LVIALYAPMPAMTVPLHSFALLTTARPTAVTGRVFVIGLSVTAPLLCLRNPEGEIEQEGTETTEGTFLRSLCCLMFKSHRAGRLICRSITVQGRLRPANPSPYGVPGATESAP